MNGTEGCGVGEDGSDEHEEMGWNRTGPVM